MYLAKEVTSPTFFNQEEVQQNALNTYELLDISAEAELDALTDLAAQLCGAPISFIALLSEKRQWFKSKIGLDMPEIPKTVSLRQHAIMGKEVFEVMDAATDARFQGNPLMTDNPNIRFYAEAPLITPQGHALGALCIIDTMPRILTQDQRNSLEVIARQVMLHFELRQTRLERIREQEILAQANAKLQRLQESMEQQIQLLLEEITILDKKVNANASSEAGPTLVKFKGMKEQAAILSQSLELLRSA